jgi:hypothetical protein
VRLRRIVQLDGLSVLRMQNGSNCASRLVQLAHTSRMQEYRNAIIYGYLDFRFRIATVPLAGNSWNGCILAFLLTTPGSYQSHARIQECKNIWLSGFQIPYSDSSTGWKLLEWMHSSILAYAWSASTMLDLHESSTSCCISLCRTVVA